MAMARKIPVFSLCVALALGWAFAAQAAEGPHAKGGFYLAPMAGAIFFLDEPNIDDHAVVGGRVGYFLTERISLEADFDYSYSQFNGPPPAEAYDGLNVNHYFGLLNGLYHFGPVMGENLFPYLMAGLGGGHMRTSLFNETGFAGQYGGGLLYKLTDLLSLRGEVRHLLMTDPSESNVIVGLGAVLNFGGKEKPLPPPPPVAAPKDSDGDGVTDDKDECPDTKPGRKVDEKGCTFMQRGGVLEGVYFDVNKAVIKPESYSILDEAAQTLKDYPNMVVEIGGHTDSTGSAALNARLSLQRAQAVKRYLVSKGVPEAQLKVQGYGPSKPIADNATPEGRAKNRRIEFKVVSH
jgi:OOP family OmpA-OmpF porin